MNPYLHRRDHALDLPAITAWNAGIERSRREYRLNPVASCGVTDCDRLRAHGRTCRIHAGPNYRGSK